MAIVTDEAGTTRDPIEVRISTCGYPMTWSNGGLREAEGKVEREGIRRALTGGIRPISSCGRRRWISPTVARFRDDA